MDQWALVQVLGIAVAIAALGAMVFVGWLDVKDARMREQRDLREHEARMARISEDLREVRAVQDLVEADKRATGM